MTYKRQWTATIAIASLAVFVAEDPATAAENATGVYLLGSKLPLSGIVPGEGLYFQNDLYLYRGEIGGAAQLPTGGQIIVGAEGLAVFELPTLLYITPWEVLGGNFGVGAVVPLGYLDVDASIGPLEVTDDIFTFGDPVLTSILGWHAGNWHWSLGALVNVPIGDYQEGEIANLAFHRWAGDISGGITYLHPALGIDLSAAAGFTFNGENPETDYKTGTEFHAEAAATKHFGQFHLGVAGYYYNQITGDSGSGATIGDFEGEVAAIGALAGVDFRVGQLPVTARVKYFHEFDVTNRMEGDAGYLTISMPLWVPAHESTPSLK